jgi:hypothetical protein
MDDYAYNRKRLIRGVKVPKELELEFCKERDSETAETNRTVLCPFSASGWRNEKTNPGLNIYGPGTSSFAVLAEAEFVTY